MNGLRFHHAITAGLIALLGASLLSAEATVTLNASASPTSADPGVTSVSVTGHGYPSGTIPPANVTVTLNPATTGAGPSGTTTATKVTVVSGTTERVTFKVPTSISVTTATAYEVSISGTTESGTPFASGNTSALTVNAPVTVTTASPLPEGSVSVNYSETLQAAGGTGSYTWAVSSGSLPAGLTLSSAGVISGTPSATGTSHFEAKATDTDKSAKAKEFTLVIESALSITTNSPLPTGTVNVGYSQTLAASGGTAPYTWSVSGGSLPAGLTLSAAGQITGTPSASGTPSFTIQVTDNKQVSTTKLFSVTINPALMITTNSPLPTGTVNVAYSKAVAATGGSGQYTWSVSVGSLPAGLTLSAAGQITGTPSTASSPSFTIQVTDSNLVSTTKPFSVTIDPALQITTTSPLPNGEVTVPYSLALAATGGSGQYTWSISTGSLPSGLTLAAATGVISGTPTAAVTANFTAVATDTNNATGSQPFALTTTQAPVILSLSPNSGTQGISVQVTITGQGTHFVQGTTTANFGPGISVGNAAAGSAGPVTVTSATSATADIAIETSATIGSQTVLVATGAEQESSANGFAIQAFIPIISVTTTATTPLSPLLSGFNDPYVLHGVEYWDPKYLPLVESLDPGWIRFPAGTTSMAFDWQTAHENNTWISQITPELPTALQGALPLAQKLTQAKGGACFSGGSCVSDFATFIKTLNANATVVINGFTDNTTNTAGLMASTAQSAGMNVLTWELDNEAYCCTKIFPTADPAEYLASVYNPYYQNIISTTPGANTSVSYMGEYSGLLLSYTDWDGGIKAYSPNFWQGAVFHIYPITNDSIAVSDEEQTLNGILAHGTTDYYTSYIQPLIGENTPVFFTEMNSDGYGNLFFETYIYNAIFMTEWTSRMSTIPQVKAIGITDLFLSNTYQEGTIRAVNDFQTYLVDQVNANPNYSTNTATNPDTQYQFYMSTIGLALEIVNPVINGSNATWATSLNGGPTVPIEGFDGQPVPAIYTQGYQGIDGANYLLIFNKSNTSVQMALEVNGNLLPNTLTLTYITSTTDTAANTATDQNAVQIQTGTSSNPLTIGPYSVTRVQW